MSRGDRAFNVAKVLAEREGWGVCWVEISYRNRVGLNIGAVR